MRITKSEEAFIRDGINEGMPKPFITSIIWMCRKLKIQPSFLEMSELSNELDNYLLEGRKPDRRSSQLEAE